LRTAAIGGLAFTVLYLVHRLLQGTGPDSSSAAAVADYNLAHRGALLASEVALGLGLLAFIPFVAALVLAIWRAEQQTLAIAVAISGGVFMAMGFVSSAAETALIGVADSNQPAAVLALDQLQGRTPIVLTITAPVAVLSLGDPTHRPGLALAGRGRLRRCRGLSARFGLQRPGADPRGEGLTHRGWRLHRLDARAQRRPMAHRVRNHSPTAIAWVGSTDWRHA